MLAVSRPQLPEVTLQSLHVAPSNFKASSDPVASKSAVNPAYDPTSVTSWRKLSAFKLLMLLDPSGKFLLIN